MGSRQIKSAIVLLLVAATLAVYSFSGARQTDYASLYTQHIQQLQQQEQALLAVITVADLSNPADVARIDAAIAQARNTMKAADIWLRYLEPLAYKHINGPLPVEWETEVFEKFEKPYRRDGAGFTLAWQHLHEAAPQRDTLLQLVRSAIEATSIYTHDSITVQQDTYHNFYLCNRLFLLNLAAIYTTGFDCPDERRIIPELRHMLSAVAGVYKSFGNSYPAQALPAAYCTLYDELCRYVAAQPETIDSFDHYTFIRKYVDPLYRLNQQLIMQHHVVSHSLIDYTLSKQVTGIFSKGLYNGQNTRGVFLRVADSATLLQIAAVGKQLFFDPVLSANGKRSCASCHKPEQCFTDTTAATSLHLNGSDRLPRNTPSLINAGYNHLLMADGRHHSLQQQALDVITNPSEMGCSRTEIVSRVMDCPDYRRTFNRLLQATPSSKEVTEEHIVSAITTFYGSYSSGYSLFDSAMNYSAVLSPAAQHGFNLFMGKAQCGTCHFVPFFNGVKPPYVGSEFEVLGVPADTAYTRLSADTGRSGAHAAPETFRAFRTGTLRNISRTAPYMHNGVFTNLQQVLDFYDAGGGAGHGLAVPNQTLSSDSLHLSPAEKSDIISFLYTLNEEIPTISKPDKLPRSRNKVFNNRIVGGIY